MPYQRAFALTDDIPSTPRRGQLDAETPDPAVVPASKFKRTPGRSHAVHRFETDHSRPSSVCSYAVDLFCHESVDTSAYDDDTSACDDIFGLFRTDSISSMSSTATVQYSPLFGIASAYSSSMADSSTILLLGSTCCQPSLACDCPLAPCGHDECSTVTHVASSFDADASTCTRPCDLSPPRAQEAAVHAADSLDTPPPPSCTAIGSAPTSSLQPCCLEALLDASSPFNGPASSRMPASNLRHSPCSASTALHVFCTSPTLAFSHANDHESGNHSTAELTHDRVAALQGFQQQCAYATSSLNVDLERRFSDVSTDSDFSIASDACVASNFSTANVAFIASNFSACRSSSGCFHDCCTSQGSMMQTSLSGDDFDGTSVTSTSGVMCDDPPSPLHPSSIEALLGFQAEDVVEVHQALAQADGTHLDLLAAYLHNARVAAQDAAQEDHQARLAASASSSPGGRRHSSPMPSSILTTQRHRSPSACRSDRCQKQTARADAGWPTSAAAVSSPLS